MSNATQTGADDPVGWSAVRALVRERLAPLGELLAPPGAFQSGAERMPPRLPAAKLAVTPHEGAVPAAGWYPASARVTLWTATTPELERLSGAVLHRLVGWRPDAGPWRLRGMCFQSLVDGEAGELPGTGEVIREQTMIFHFMAFRDEDGTAD